MTTMPCFQNFCRLHCRGLCKHRILPFSNSSRSPAPPGSASFSNNGDALSPGSIPRVLPAVLMLASWAMGQVM